MTNPAQLLRETADAIARLGACSTDFDALTDEQLVAGERLVSDHRRALDTYAAWLAGQVAHRSRRELGYTGLAQRAGFTSPEALIQSISGSTRAEAVKFVRVGELMTTPAPDAGPSWLAPVAAAVACGLLGADAADAIRRGLGAPDAAVSDTQLQAAAETLLAIQAELATALNADELFKRARHLRDDLDVAGVADREADRHNQRYLRIARRPDGMVGGSFLLDPEDGGMLIAAIDAVTSPRRGGPRFGDPVRKAAAEKLLADPRSNEQLAVDALMGMVRVAADSDPGRMLGGRPAVRIVVTEQALSDRHGFGHLEGSHETVSLETIDRHICDTGILGIKFDTNGRGINIGRDQRLFTQQQRVILAVRDGGCRWPDCDRPPSWAEAHHINQWARDHGRTDLADGMLLCRRHHMLLHNNHWQIIRDAGTYWLRPPRAQDPRQTLIPMPSRTPEIGALQAGTLQSGALQAGTLPIERSRDLAPVR